MGEGTRHRGPRGCMGGRGGRATGPGPRSMEGLRWLGRVDVAGLEPLELVLGTGRSTTYSHVARLAAAGCSSGSTATEGAWSRSPRKAGGIIGDRPTGARSARPSMAGRAHGRAGVGGGAGGVRGRDW